jgi:hypothetical protein
LVGWLKGIKGCLEDGRVVVESVEELIDYLNEDGEERNDLKPTGAEFI